MGQIDSSRYLLGDANGRLLMLFVESEEKMDAEDTMVTSMRIEVLGEVPDQFVRAKTQPVHGNLFNDYSPQPYNMNNRTAYFPHK